MIISGALGTDVAVPDGDEIKQGFHCTWHIDIPLDKASERQLF
jgi:hypothetical protein